MALKLKSISIRNWMQIKAAEIVFPENGLVLVTGSNLAANGKLQSVGAGKTSVGEAISRTLVGINGRFTALKSCSTHKRGNTYVHLVCDLDGSELVVESGYRCAELSKVGEALRFTYGGKTIERSRIQETRDELSRLINIAPEIAPWTVFLDGRKLDFSQMSQAQAVELLMASLAQPPWNQYYGNAKSTLVKFKQSMAVEESEHAEAGRRVRESEQQISEANENLRRAQVDYEKRLKEVTNQRAKLKTNAAAHEQATKQAQARIAAIKKELDATISKNASRHHQLEIALNEANERLQEAQDAKVKSYEKHSWAQAVYCAENDKLSGLKNLPTSCPTCGKPWDKGANKEQVARQHAVVQTALQTLDKCTTLRAAAIKLHESHQKTVRALTGQIQDLQAKESTVNLSEEVENLEQTITEAQRGIHSCEVELARLEKVNDGDVKQARAVLAERQRVLDDSKKKLRDTAAVYAESREALKVVEYWHKAFGPTGIPNMILQDALPPLNSISRRISSLLTGGTIQVSYSTRRELASGDQKAELNIGVNNEIGSQELEGNSKGEGGLANFIIAETLSEIGNVSRRIGYRWYDEVVPNQDEVVCKTVFAYLKEKAERLGILVFLVEHNPVAANYADYILRVEKRVDDTVIAWV